jgi:archaellum component FlaG (FlaF/FlaG flagellin family)
MAVTELHPLQATITQTNSTIVLYTTVPPNMKMDIYTIVAANPNSIPASVTLTGATRPVYTVIVPATGNTILYRGERAIANVVPGDSLGVSANTTMLTVTVWYSLVPGSVG